MDIPQVSKEFWEDAEWAWENYGELQKKIKNVWIAIAAKKIISWGKNLTEVECKAEALLDKKDFVTIFIESGATIY
jgi:hypothetical protein